MLPRSLKTIFARVADAWDQRDRGQGYVLQGGAPTAFAVGSLRIDISECYYVDSLGVPQRQAATNVTPGPASATLTRADLIWIAQGGGIGVTPGVGVVPSATVPVIPPAIPANATPIAIAYIGPGAVDYSDPTKAYIHDLRPFSVGPTMDNFCSNGDFERRGVLSYACQENFTDVNGFDNIGTAPKGVVAANVYTFGAANNELQWPGTLAGGAYGWRDGRISITFKAVAVGGIYQLRWRIDAANYVRVLMNAGSLTLSKVIGGANTDLYTAANPLTVNRWYWLELQKYGSHFTGRIYDTGGVIPGVTKAASILMGQTSTNVVADAAIAGGASASFTSDQAGCQIGGLAIAPGGFYVEWPMPENWGDAVIFGGVLGGQAICYDEAVNAGPIGKQSAIWVVIPATNRYLALNSEVHRGNTIPSGVYAVSAYMKVANKGGAGNLGHFSFQNLDVADAFINETVLADNNDAAWTRKVGILPTTAATRSQYRKLYVNPGQTASGSLWFALIQQELGPVATAWRNAPQDFGPIVLATLSARDIALAADGEIDPRDLALLVYCPYNCTVEMSTHGVWTNSGANSNYLQHRINDVAATAVASNLGTTPSPVALHDSHPTLMRLARGKHRLSVWGVRGAGTLTMLGATYAPTVLTAVVNRGK